MKTFQKSTCMISSDMYSIDKIIAIYKQRDVYKLYWSDGLHPIFVSLGNSYARTGTFSPNDTAQNAIDWAIDNGYDVYQFDDAKEFLEYTLKRLSEKLA